MNAIPEIVRRTLAASGERFKLRQSDGGTGLKEAAAAAGIPLEKLARSLILETARGPLMVIFPADRRLDPAPFAPAPGQRPRNCSTETLLRLAPECDARALPPLPQTMGLRAVVDASLDGLDELFFPAGHLDVFIRADRAAFDKLVAGALRGRRFLAPEPEAAEPVDPRGRVERLKQLPSMPGIAAEIASLRNNPLANVSELAAVISQDPSLAAQLVRYARSPFYGYAGKIESLETAIARVLGMDFVMDFAFGLSLGRPFRNPKEGPLGLNSFWEHAVACAALAQALCNTIDYDRRPSAGTAYLAGLLHNFGFLILGHLFRGQFDRLNRALAEQPDRPLAELEREAVGIAHTEMGLWLMDAWDMPAEIIEAVRMHHDAEYDGPHAVYPNLVFVANALLRRSGIGDADSVEIPMEMLERLGLDEAALEIALGSVLEGMDNLRFVAEKMVA